MTSFLLLLMMTLPGSDRPFPLSSAAGYLSRGEYTNTLLGFSMHLPGKWELRELPRGDTVPSGGAQGNAFTEGKPSRVCFELESKKVGMMFVCGFRRDSKVDLREQVDAAFAFSRKRLVIQGPEPIVTKTWK